jgi:hypothetical protein
VAETGREEAVVRLRLSGIAVIGVACLALPAPSAWARAPSDGDIVVKAGRLHVDSAGTPSANGLVKWRKGASETSGVDCCTNRVFPLDGSGSSFETTANRFSIVLTPATSRAFRIESYDANGAFVGATFAPDETFGDFFEVDDDAEPAWSFTSEWTHSRRRGAFDRTASSTKMAGAAAVYGPFTAHSFGIVVTKGPMFGSAAVYLDGQLAGTLDCHAAAVRTRRIALVLSPDRAGLDESHEIAIVNLATAGHPKLEIDAMATLWSD